MTSAGHLDFNIVNGTSTTKDLTRLELKFYFLSESVLTSPVMQCSSFSAGGCSMVSASFVSVTPPRPTADSAMKVVFSGGSIPAGGSAEVRVILSNMPSATFDETRFYSYAAADTTYTDAPNIAVYSGASFGTLLWGTPP
jgi:hypothetical protein